MELFKIFGTLALMGADNVNKQLDDVTGKANNTQDKFSSACKKIGTALAGAFTADKVIQFGKDVVTTAGQSEASFAKVTTLLDTSKVNTDAYYASVKKGANESHVSISDFSEALYQALSASVDAGHAVDFTTKAVELSKAGFTSAATAVDVMTTAINAYGLSADDADHISDNLITTQNLGKTTVDELASSMGKVIPTASAYGVNIDNLCSSYAIMTKSGIATAESTTYLKGMLNELGKEGSTVSDTLKDKTGKSFAECMNSGMSLGDVLQILSDSVDGDTTAFANLWQSQEAGTGALALVNAGSKEFNSTLNQMQNNAGTTASAYEKIEGTMEAKTEALKAKFSNLKSELGEKLIPVVDKVVDALSNKVIPAIEKMAPEISNVAKIAAGAATTFAAFKIGSQIQKIATAFGEAKVQLALFKMGAEGASVAQGVMNGQLGLGEAAVAVLTGQMTLHEAVTLGVTRAQTALNAAWNANPIGIVITLIAALVAGFIYLWNTSEGFRNFWKGLWDGLKNIVSTAVDGIKGFFSGVADRFKVMGDSIKEHGGGIKGTFTALGDHIKDSFSKGFEAAKGSTDSFWGDLQVSYEEGGGGLSGVVEAVMDKQNDLIRGAFATIGNLFGVNLDGIADKIVSFRQNVRDKVVDLIYTVQNAVVDFFTGMGEKISGFFNDVITAVGNFFSPIIDAIKTAWETIKNVVQVGIMFIKELLSAAFQILTLPWQFIWKNFGDEITSAWETIKSVVSTALNAIKTTISTVWNAIKAVMEPILNAIKTAVETAWNAIKTATTTVFNAVKSVAETVWNGIKSVITTVVNAIKTAVTTAWNAIKTVTITVWNAIKTAITTVVNGIKSVVTSVFNAVKSVVTSVWNGIKSVTTSVWNAVKTAVTTPVNAIKSTVTSVFNSVKSTVSNIFNGIRSTATSVWNGIKSAITRPVEAARDAVGNAIQRMRSFFHFSWSLPHLALPHLSISGHFSINPPSVPHFGISWYKKAMEQPFLFTKPTLFDVNPATGQAKGAGEAGDEMMYGKNNLMNDIRTAVAAENDDVIQKVNEMFNKLLNILEQYFPEFANLKMVLDSGAIVGELAPAMDEELGNIIRKKERGANW